MKRIIEFFGRNIKGADFKHALSAINVIVGRNFKNKTARLDAMQIALAGYHPAASRKPNDIFDAFAGAAPSMSCGVAFDDGFRVTRMFTQSAKGAIKYSDEYEGLPAGVKEWACAPVLIDHDAYLGLSGRERMKLLFSMLDIKCDVSPQSISAAVKNIKLEENTEHSEKAIGEVVAFINGTGATKITPQEWLEALAELARDKKKLADANAKRLAQTVLGLAATQGDVVNVNRPIETQIKTQRDRLDVIARDGATLRERQRVAQRNSARRVQIETQLASVKNNDDQIAELLDVLKQTKALIVELPSRDDAAKEADKLRSDVIKAEAALRGLTDQRVDLKRDFDKDMKRVDCPCCGAEGEDWKSKREKKFNREDKRVAAAIETLTETLKTMRRAEAIAADALKKIDDVRAEQTELRNTERKYTATLTALQNEDKAVAAIRAELAAIIVEDIDALTAQIDAKIKEHGALQPEIVRLEAEQKKITAAKADAASRARTVAEAALATQVSAVWKATCEIIEEKQRELIKTSIGGVIDSANRLCGPILQSPLVFHADEIGRFAGSRFVTHKTFSGSEKALTYAALCVALGARSAARIVMIDELGTIDAENKIALMRIVADLIELDCIDQFVGIDVAMSSAYGKGVNVITV